jgi:isoquinoline 1-oxidoreductase beta subunit
MYFRHIDAAAAVAGGASAELTRREFLKLSTLAGSGLTLGMLLPGCAPGTGTGAKGAAATGPLAMPFVRISPENTVTVICKHVEGGQGVWTGLPAIVAEELDAAWAQMRVENAPAQVPLYGNTAFDPRGTMQGTGGSSSLANSWLQLRQAGATARAMLVAAAAQTWKVPAGEITVSEGVVAHAGARQQATFGQLAGAAAQQPVPKEVTLKDPGAFKFIGVDRKFPRLDSRAKSTGAQQFAIDVILPGMMTAVVLRPPRFGGKVSSFDATQAKAVPGVVDVVQIPRGVAVVAQDMYSAKKGREALRVTWDETAAEKRGSAAIMKEYKALARGPEALTISSQGDAEAARDTHGRRRVRVSLPRACADGATHGCLPAGPGAVRDLGRLPVPDHRPDECRRAGWPAAGAGHHPHAGGGGHLRPARQPRVRLHRRGRLDRQGHGRQVPGAPHLDTRG